MSPEALELELDRLHPAAFGWALACCMGDRAAAEDALQTSYLKILDGRARFDGRASFRTWLFAVVRYTAAGLRRRAWLRRWLPLAALGATPDGRPDPALGLAAAAVVIASVAVALLLTRRGAPTVFAAVRLKTPTDFLLTLPNEQLLRTVPELGRASVTGFTTIDLHRRTP